MTVVVSVVVVTVLVASVNVLMDAVVTVPVVEEIEVVQIWKEPQQADDPLFP